MSGILRGLRLRAAGLLTTTAVGHAGESRAEAHLLKAGLRIIARNFRVKGGEIDLIAQDGETTVFVEVRLRQSRDYGGAAASITAKKRARIILAARHWLQREGETPCRFDCVLIEGGQLEWLQDAFSAD
jgi:putative endonuclease